MMFQFRLQERLREAFGSRREATGEDAIRLGWQLYQRSLARLRARRAGERPEGDRARRDRPGLRR